MTDKSKIFGLPPLTFIHFIDINTSITYLAVGPKTVVLQSHERLVLGPLPFIKIPLGKYCVILDPVCKYESGKPVEQKLGQSSVKFYGEPFPLYPGERLEDAPNFGETRDYSKAVKALPVIKANSGIRLEAILDHVDGKIQRKAGDRWQLSGPITYKPVPEVKIIGYVNPVVINVNQALRLKAEQDCIDQNKRKRVTGEEWLVTTQGAYLPGIFEQVMDVESAHILTKDTGLHLRATQTFKTSSNCERLAGDEWLLTGEETEQYSPQIGVEVIKSIRKTVLPKGKYCVVLYPVDEKGKPQWGKKELRIGCCSFFLHPGEQLEVGIQKTNILSPDEAIVVQAKEAFEDKMAKDVIKRCPGDRWRIQGPLEYIPPIEVDVINKLKMIPLDKNDGIYVRDIQSGTVRLVMGPQSYMLTAYEELWAKPLSDTVEQLLKQGGGAGKADIRKLAYYDQSIDPLILKCIAFDAPLEST